jgi:nitroreductase
MSLGCLLENMWLMATALAVDFQVVSILGAPEAANEVRRILQVPDHLSVAFAVRLGRVPPDAGSDPKVRREIHDFTHYNLFGSKVVLQTKARPSV